jgi:hypothetical protein
VRNCRKRKVGKLTYYERWIVAFANILFQKAILTPEESRKENGRSRGAPPSGWAQ